MKRPLSILSSLLVALTMLSSRTWAVLPPYTTNLKLFLDASTLVLTDGAAVSSWADQSGNSNNAATFSGSHALTYKTNIFGTFPAVRSGVNANDGLAGSIGSCERAGTATIIVATGNWNFPNAAFGGVAALYPTSATNDYDNAAAMVLSADNTADRFQLSTNGGTDSPVGGIRNATVIAMQIRNGSATTIWINGAKLADGNNAPTNFNAQNYVIGQRYLTGSKSTGTGAKFDLAYFGIWNSTLSDANVLNVSRWMMQQLGSYAPTGTRSRVVNP